MDINNLVSFGKEIQNIRRENKVQNIFLIYFNSPDSEDKDAGVAVMQAGEKENIILAIASMLDAPSNEVSEIILSAFSRSKKGQRLIATAITEADDVLIEASRELLKK